MNELGKQLPARSAELQDSVVGDTERVPTIRGESQTFDGCDCEPLPGTSEETVSCENKPAPNISAAELKTFSECESLSKTSKEFVSGKNRPVSNSSAELHQTPIRDDGEPSKDFMGTAWSDNEPVISEECMTFIPGNGDTFPYLRDEAEFQLIYAIPQSLLLEKTTSGEGVTIEPDEQSQREEINAGFTRYFNLTIYPDGDSKENEGYISLIFEENTNEMFLQLCKLDVTLALLDVADKSRRFAQSFTLDHFGMLDRNPEKVAFGLNRYARRDALLSADLFCDGKILLQCDVKLYTIENVLHEPELPFDVEECYDESGHHISILLERDHPLWKILCEHSQYFHKLIVTDGAGRISMYDEKEYQAFDAIVKCVMSGTDPGAHPLNTRELLNLYEYADYYLLREIKEKCGDVLKERMNSRTACRVVAVADMHGDADLKKSAIQYALQHWRRVVASKSWDALKEERPDLVREMEECRTGGRGLTRKRKRPSSSDNGYVQQFPNMYQ